MPDTPHDNDEYSRPEGKPSPSDEEAIRALNRALDTLLGTPEGTDHGFRFQVNPTDLEEMVTWTAAHPEQPEYEQPENTAFTYLPPPCVAAQMGVAGNPACHCDTPMQAMLCMEGHMTECHAGQSCTEARCSHLSRYE